MKLYTWEEICEVLIFALILFLIGEICKDRPRKKQAKEDKPEQRIERNISFD